jgi:hypothetical protein
MHGQLRIEEMYAYVVMDTDDTEGVPAFQSGDLMMPMMGADMKRAEMLRGIAQEFANTGVAVTLVKFTNRETVEVFEKQR